ncbi:hypothetical protein [Nocardia sp. NPDC005366]|uniref:hypothetical protein n=1 Tax=Nocardia sp. NPDC005366 TaxID=3156878 RepID=UPI0033BE31ED
MTPNNARRGQRFDTGRARALCRGALMALVISTSLAAVSCTPATVESPPSRTLGEFCEPLRDFLAEQQIVRDAKVEPFQNRLNKQVKDISDDQIRCDYESADSDGVYAISILSPVEGEFNFDETNKFLTSDVRGYVYLDGHSSPVWLRDARQFDEKFQTKSTADFTTTVGRWQGSIELFGGKKPLPVSDAQVSQLADALIAATAKMNESPAGS